MSDPYIIWTMRRTGGTTLATLLSLLSEYPRIQHEPFNGERKLGHVYKAFVETGDVKQLRAALRESLVDRPVIKHCYELMDHAFNKALMQITTELEYRHIVLDRRNETDRIISLELARLTGAWGGDVAQKIYPAIETGDVVLERMNMDHAMYQMRLCHTRRKELVAMTKRSNPPPFVVYFEDVYSDPVQGRALIGRLLAYLGIRPEDHDEYETLLEDALLRRGQNTSRITQAVPDFETDKARLLGLDARHKTLFAAS